jgi:integrase
MWAPDEKGRMTRWKGGYIEYGRAGRPTFYIRRMVEGIEYNLSTRAHSLDPALKHLARFESDPARYRPSGVDGAEPLYLTPDLVREFLAWSERPEKDGGRGNTPEWRQKQHRELLWWMSKLKDGRGRALDLRRLNLREHILAPLNGDAAQKPKAAVAPGRGHKIRVLKTLYSFLREEVHAIEPVEDPTFGKLKTPQAGVAQRKGKKKVTTRENVEAVISYLQKLSQVKQDGKLRPERALAVYADALVVQAGTGWHTTEVIRFAHNGEAIDIPPGVRREPGVVGIVVCPLHKSGSEHRTKVNQRVFDAAKRLLLHGTFSRKWYDTAVREACDRLRIERFTPANMRHTNATYAVDHAGEDPKRVSDFLGHSEATSKKFYQTYATVPKVPTIMDDPATTLDAAALAARVADLEQKLAEAQAPKNEREDAITAELEALLARVKKTG